MTIRPATINDVAAAAGVSRQTVTRAVNDMPGISSDTRERVLAAARALHYRPSRFGRGLVKPQARTLGLIIQDLSNPYYPELASAVLRLATDLGWNVVLGERADRPASDDFLVQQFTSQVDAIISFTNLALPSSNDGLSDLPIVEIDPAGPNSTHGRVDLDMGQAVDDAVRHLHQRGVRRPVVFDHAGPSSRATLFLRAFATIGIDATRFCSASTDLEGGRDAAEDVLRERPDTDCIVAYNDVMGFGVLRALRLAGIDIPGQIRVLGVDGLGIGRFITPRLSTLAIDMPLVARAAVDVVVAMHAGELPRDGPSTHRRVAYRMEVGEST